MTNYYFNNNKSVSNNYRNSPTSNSNNEAIGVLAGVVSLLALGVTAYFSTKKTEEVYYQKDLIRDIKTQNHAIKQNLDYLNRIEVEKEKTAFEIEMIEIRRKEKVKHIKIKELKNKIYYIGENIGKIKDELKSDNLSFEERKSLKIKKNELYEKLESAKSELEEFKNTSNSYLC